MNYFGSYRALLGSAVAALAAAIEIYNKPNFRYREECSVILLVNAWELALKACLSRKRIRIFYKKKRNQPYRTLSLNDALNKAREHFPSSIDYEATRENLKQLTEYRDTFVHFYNKKGLGLLLYALGRTCITNLSDFICDVFERDLSEEIALSLQPLGLAPPIDPVQFLSVTPEDEETPDHVREYTRRLRELVVDLNARGHDTDRLLTVFRVGLESTKKVSAADLVFGIKASGGEEPPVVVERRVDPDKSHPYRESDIIASSTDPDRKGMELVVGGRSLTQYPFRAIGCQWQPKMSHLWQLKMSHFLRGL